MPEFHDSIRFSKRVGGIFPIQLLLLREKILVKVSEDLVFHRDALAGLRLSLAELKSTAP